MRMWAQGCCAREGLGRMANDGGLGVLGKAGDAGGDVARLKA